jgi:hypothetical protein
MTTIERKQELFEECREKIWNLLLSYPLDNDDFDENGDLTRDGSLRMAAYVKDGLTSDEYDLEEEFQLIDKAQEHWDAMADEGKLPYLLDEAGERRYRSANSTA